jgi:hypothetical protein
MSEFTSEVKTSQSGNEFRVWNLATFKSKRQPKGVAITGACGAQLGVRAAAWNLQNRRSARTNRYLQNVLRSGVQMGSIQGGVRVYVPGAQVHVLGYDEPISVKLEAVVDGPQDIDLALSLMVNNLAQIVARGVYGCTREEASAEAEAEDKDDEVGEIVF